MRDDRKAQNRRKFKYRLNEAYVKFYAVNVFGAAKINYLYCFKPILVGLLPNKIYAILHRQNKKTYEDNEKE